MEFSDVVQEGITGLITAAQRFDPSLAFRFSTYAFHWIRQNASCASQQLEPDPLAHMESRYPNRGKISKRRRRVASGRALCPAHLRRLDCATLDCNHPFAEVLERERIEGVTNALNRLPRKEAEVIRRRFGIGFDGGYMIEEIGRQLKLIENV